jgi:hypothetical protein
MAGDLPTESPNAREIVIRVSLGDVVHLVESAVWAVRWRSWTTFRRSLWCEREKRRRGAWEPFTVGDFVRLRRMRRYLSSHPRAGVRPWWRHAPDRRAGRGA